MHLMSTKSILKGFVLMFVYVHKIGSQVFKQIPVFRIHTGFLIRVLKEYSVLGNMTFK